MLPVFIARLLCVRVIRRDLKAALRFNPVERDEIAGLLLEYYLNASKKQDEDVSEYASFLINDRAQMHELRKEFVKAGQAHLDNIYYIALNTTMAWHGLRLMRFERQIDKKVIVSIEASINDFIQKNRFRESGIPGIRLRQSNAEFMEDMFRQLSGDN